MKSECGVVGYHIDRLPVPVAACSHAAGTGDRISPLRARADRRHMIPALFVLLVALAFAACSDSGVGDTPTEFVASLEDFGGYGAWPLVTEPRRGPDPSGRLGIGSHGWTDSELVRTIRVKQPTAYPDSSGNYPVGTIFLKELTRQGRVESVVAMAKRGNGYNPAGRGWEFFIIENGAITSRGDTVDRLRCFHCHGHAAAGSDLIFSR